MTLLSINLSHIRKGSLTEQHQEEKQGLQGQITNISYTLHGLYENQKLANAQCQQSLRANDQQLYRQNAMDRSAPEFGHSMHHYNINTYKAHMVSQRAESEVLLRLS